MATITLTAKDQGLTKILTFYDAFKVENNNPYALLIAKTNETTITVYKSGKVVFQGKHAEQEASIFYGFKGIRPVGKTMPPTSSKHATSGQTNDELISIGSDEVGTGDYFGPVVVCAAYLSEESLNDIRKLDIRDSKQLTDEAIRKIAPKLFKLCPYSLLVVRNEKYNQVSDAINLNKMKAMLHKQAVTELKKKINGNPKVVIDQFCAKEHFNAYVNDDQFLKDVIYTTKAESKYLSVAIASMLARYTFLQEMDQLSKKVGQPLLKGASSKVDEQAKALVKQFGPDILTKIAKRHFKNTDKVFNKG